LEDCGPCPVFANFTPAFALQLRKKHGKPSVRARKTSVRIRKPQSGYSIHITKTPTHYKTNTFGLAKNMTGKLKRTWREILIDHTEQAIHICLISAPMKDFEGGISFERVVLVILTKCVAGTRLMLGIYRIPN